MSVHHLDGTLDEVRVSLVEEWFDGCDDRDMLHESLLVIGNGGMILVGPHQEDGYCWCQPRLEPHGMHAHPTHVERNH